MRLFTNNTAVAVEIKVEKTKGKLYWWGGGGDKEFFQILHNIHGDRDNWQGSSYIATLRHLAEHKYGNTADDIGGLKQRVDYLRSKQKASYYRSVGKIALFNQVIAGALAAGVCTYNDLSTRIQG